MSRSKLDYISDRVFIDEMIKKTPDIFANLVKANRIENIDISNDLDIWKIFIKDNLVDRLYYDNFYRDYNNYNNGDIKVKVNLSEAVENIIVEYYCGAASKFKSFLKRVLFGDVPISYESSVKIIKAEIKNKGFYKNKSIAKCCFKMRVILTDKYGIIDYICKEFFEYSKEKTQISFIKEIFDDILIGNSDIIKALINYNIYFNAANTDIKTIINTVENFLMKGALTYILNYYSYKVGKISHLNFNSRLEKFFHKELKQKHSEFKQSLSVRTANAPTRPFSGVLDAKKIQELIFAEFLSLPFIKESIKVDIQLVYSLVL